MFPNLYRGFQLLCVFSLLKLTSLSLSLPMPKLQSFSDQFSPLSILSLSFFMFLSPKHSEYESMNLPYSRLCKVNQECIHLLSCSRVLFPRVMPKTRTFRIWKHNIFLTYICAFRLLGTLGVTPLRFGGLTFDDSNLFAGQVGPINICLLALYVLLAWWRGVHNS